VWRPYVKKRINSTVEHSIHDNSNTNVNMSCLITFSRFDLSYSLCKKLMRSMIYWAVKASKDRLQVSVETDKCKKESCISFPSRWTHSKHGRESLVLEMILAWGWTTSKTVVTLVGFFHNMS
jgi:hypothetical protein